jgi:hypothetical protein
MVFRRAGRGGQPPTTPINKEEDEMTNFRGWVMALSLALVFLAPAPAWADTEVIAWNNVVAHTGSGKPATADEIKRAFVVAAAKRGWTVTEAGPGTMTLTLVLRTHTLVMDLAYEDGKYSLSYKNSINLDYKDTNGKKTIHRNYVNWNNNLIKDASAALIQM